MGDALVSEAIAAIVADAEAAFDGGRWPAHPLDDPVAPGEEAMMYLGAAGMVWALRRLGSRLDLDAVADEALRRRPALRARRPRKMHSSSCFRTAREAIRSLYAPRVSCWP